MKRISILIFLLIFIKELFAFSLLDYNFSARMSGAGSSFILREPDISILPFAPAIAPEIKNQQILTGFSSIFNQRLNFLSGYLYPGIITSPLLGLGGVLSLSFDKVENYDFTSIYIPGEYTKAGETDYIESLFITSAGLRTIYFWRMGLNTGLNIKFLYQRIGTDKYTGAGFDLNLILRHKLFIYSIMLKDIYTFLSSKEVFPFKLTTGFLLEPFTIYNAIFPTKQKRPSSEGSPSVEIFDKILNLSFQLETVFEKKIFVKFYMGSEFLLNQKISMRIGYNTREGISYGCGLNIYNFFIDFAWIIHPELEKSFKLSLIYSISK